MIDPEAASALGSLVAVLERLDVRWCVGGSVASSIHGMVRATMDVDIVADLSAEQVAPLVSALEATYYVDATAAHRAIAARRAFNVIHLATMTKIDLFVPHGAFDREELRRAQRTRLGDQDAWVVTPEDIVLAKLAWYRKGVGLSDRQWADVQGVLKTQADRLDRDHMARWAQQLGLEALLARAIREAGLEP